MPMDHVPATTLPSHLVSSDPVAEAHEPPGNGEQRRCERQIGDVHHARLLARDFKAVTAMTRAMNPSMSSPLNVQIPTRRSAQPPRRGR